MKPVALSPGQREDALDAMESTGLDILVVGGGVVGGRVLPSTPPPAGLTVGLVEARDYRLGHLQPLQQADPRRPALPGDARLRAGRRGAAGARSADPDARAAPGPAGAVPLPAARTGSGSGSTPAPASRSTTRSALLSGPVAAACRTTGTSPGAAPADRAVAAQGRADRRAAVLRRPGRRRPAHDVHRPHGGRVRRARREPGPGRRAPARGRAGDRRGGARTWRPGATSGSGLEQVVNATGVWTDDTQSLAGERGQFHVRASKGIHLVVPRDRIRSRLRADPAHREVRAVRHPVGPALDHRHHRHRLGAGQGPPGRELAATSTTCSTTSTPCSRRRSPATTSRACTPGCGRCSKGESEATSKLSREHAVAHTVPGLVVVAGGKYTTYRVMAKDAVDEAVHGLEQVLDRRVPRVLSPRTCRCSAPRATRRCGTSATCSPSASGLHEARIEHLLGRYGSMIHELLELSPATPSLGEPLAGTRRTTCAPRSSTRRPTRAPGTSTTCWPGVPASRSRRSTAASASLEEAAELMAPVSGLERRAGRPRGRALPQAGRGGAGEPDRCPTTRPPTPRAWAPPRWSPCDRPYGLVRG